MLAVLLCLGGCAEPLMGPGHMGTEVMMVPGMASPSAPVSAPSPPSGREIALLAPLTGADASLGPALVDAARLGLGTGTVPPLAVIDTGSRPAGAAAAARQAIAQGAALILGPLTDGEANAVAPIAGAADVDVLSFTADPAVARPGLWTLGITPAQQVAALVQAARAADHGRVAGLLPESPLGQTMARALQTARPSASIRLYTGFAGMNDGLRALSDDAPRHVNALLIAETGAGLGALARLLPQDGVCPGPVLILGPGLWAADPAGVAAAGFTGALYAAPDPAAAANFVFRYALAFGRAPPPLAAIAFDAAGIARLATQSPHPDKRFGQSFIAKGENDRTRSGYSDGNPQAGGIDTSILTSPAGFSGADGVVGLRPDGSVRRALAVYQVEPDGAHILRPAPAELSAPGL